MTSTSNPRKEPGIFGWVGGADEVVEVAVDGAVVLGLVGVPDVRLVELGDCSGAEVRGDGWVRVDVVTEDVPEVGVGDESGRAGVPPHAASASDTAAAAPSTAPTALTIPGCIRLRAVGQRRRTRTSAGRRCP